MARLFTSGFETQQAEGGFPRSLHDSFSDFTWVSGRASNRALRCTPAASSAVTGDCYIHNVPVDPATIGRNYFYRAYIRKSGTPSTGKAIVLLRVHYSTDTTPVKHVGLILKEDNTVWLCSTSTATPTNLPTTVGTPAVITDNVWYLVEMRVKTNSTGNVDCEFRLDGTTVTSATGLAVTGMDASTHWDVGRCGISANGTNPATWVDATNVTVDVDDIGTNDDVAPSGFTSGQFGAQDTWLGQGVVWVLRLASDNSITNFTGGAGGTTNLYLALINDPPVGKTPGGSAVTDTTQIRQSNSTLAGIYQGNSETLSSRGIAGIPLVAHVRTEFTGLNSSAAANALLSAASNPTIAEQTFTSDATASAYPQGWTGVMTTAVHLPTIDSTTPTVLKIRQPAPLFSQTNYPLSCCYLAMTVEMLPTSGEIVMVV